MASPGVIGSSLKHYCWNPRKSDFFPSFDAEIELDSHVVRPFKAITGRLHLNTSKLIRFNGGIRVQLDANVKLRFQTKVDNRVSTHWDVESIFQDAPEAEDGNYVLSPVRQQILGDEDDVKQNCNMEPGTYTYPFTLYLPREPLPAPFKSLYGNLQFFVAAYMGSQYCYVQVAEKLVAFGGFNDLTKCRKASEPLSHSSSLHESVFSCKPFVTFYLTSSTSGYHPGEQIPFTLRIENSKCREIKSVLVQLVRKTIYNAKGSSKTTNVTLDTFEVGLERENDSGKADKSSITTSNTDQEIMYLGTVSLPKHCIPSYTMKRIYSVHYFLQYQVEVINHPAMGKGQAEVIIGTTKPSAALLVNRLQERRTSSPQNDDPDPVFMEGRPRSNTICSRSGFHPVLLHMNNPKGRPPSASIIALTPRTNSMMSLGP